MVKLAGTFAAALAVTMLSAPIAQAQPARAEAPEVEKRRSVVISGDRIEVVGGEDGPRVFAVGGRGYLGITATNLTPELREHFGADRDRGVMIGRVHDDTPAAKAGLLPGDVITAVDGESVSSSGDITRALGPRKKGEQVRVDYLRSGTFQQAFVTLEERSGAFTWSAEGFGVQHLADIEKDLALQSRALRIDPEIRMRLLESRDCDQLRERLSDLETRLKDLEKRLK
ncbi:MAG TPA: PDZ domain-containing protein [Thermoanaerobaculia bacterium]|nr:PDZ domain-containing protein [Thermoanaerobaculia bacterium]